MKAKRAKLANWEEISAQADQEQWTLSMHKSTQCFFQPALEMSQSCVLKEAVVCKAVVREAGNCSGLDRALEEDDLVVTMHVCYLGNQILFYVMLDSSPTQSFSQAQFNTRSLH